MADIAVASTSKIKGICDLTSSSSVKISCEVLFKEKVKGAVKSSALQG